ncbi:MAG TPA: thermonuclease family protein [Actinomycetota bacterium]
MVKVGATALAVVLLSSCGASRTAPRSGASPTQVPVLKVTDGDTIHVLYGGHDERVRLIGIDTPEVPWYGGHGQCFGVQAARYMRGRLNHGSVRLTFDAELRDRYDRLLSYVYLGRELVNLTLVEMGFATADPVPPNTRMESVFAAAEARAREHRRGLWGRCPG